MLIPFFILLHHTFQKEQGYPNNKGGNESPHIIEFIERVVYDNLYEANIKEFKNLIEENKRNQRNRQGYKYRQFVFQVENQERKAKAGQ